MKKRTVITTEKREVWVISEGGVKREIPDSEGDVSGYTSEPVTPPNQAAPDALPNEKKEERNE